MTFWRIAPPGVREARQIECAGCPNNKDARCEKCGCLVAFKAWFSDNACPIGNWGATAQGKLVDAEGKEVNG